MLQVTQLPGHFRQFLLKVGQGGTLGYRWRLVSQLSDLLLNVADSVLYLICVVFEACRVAGRFARAIQRFRRLPIELRRLLANLFREVWCRRCLAPPGLDDLQRDGSVAGHGGLIVNRCATRGRVGQQPDRREQEQKARTG